MKPQTAWSIMSPDGYIEPKSIRQDREAAINHFVDHGASWDHMLKIGCRTVYVEIRVIGQEGEG